MTLLTAITNVAAEAGYEVNGSAVIGATDVTTKQLLAIANRVIGEMAEKYDWPKLWKSHSFTLSNGVSTYTLPGDMSRYHADTFWNQSQKWKVYGPMTSQEYSFLTGYDYSGIIDDRFTVRGMTSQELLIYPTPGADEAGQTVIYQYTAARPVRPRTWAQGQSVSAGSYTFYNGNYYSAQNSGTTGATPPTHTSSTASDGTITWEYYSGTYETFLADTDEPIFPQRILEQGILERFAEIKGISVAPRFDMQVDEEYANSKVARSFSMINDFADRVQFAKNGRVVIGA